MSGPAEFEALVESVTAALWERLSRPVRARRDLVCSDCTGTCARRCAFKLDDFMLAGAARIGGAPGVGRPAAAYIAHTGTYGANARSPQAAMTSSRIRSSSIERGAVSK